MYDHNNPGSLFNGSVNRFALSVFSCNLPLFFPPHSYQRGHQNMLESHYQVMALLFLGGLRYPVRWIVGFRFLSPPSARTKKKICFAFVIPTLLMFFFFFFFFFFLVGICSSSRPLLVPPGPWAVSSTLSATPLLALTES